jgi:hypothetical protein
MALEGEDPELLSGPCVYPVRPHGRAAETIAAATVRNL